MKKNYLIVSIMSLFVSSLSAQVDVTNTGILYIGSATDTFFVGGAFTNSGTAGFTNNGITNVKKDLSNSQSSMTAGTGTLLLDGNTAQTISGTQVFKTNNLVSNNSAGILLNNDLSVSGVHTFSSGMITTSATPNYMIYEAGSSYTGDNDARHIDGWVKKRGSTDFIFPVGYNVYERTVALTALTSNSEFDVKRNPRVTPNFIQLMSPLVLVDTSEYWTINKISGGSATITMNWNTAKVPFPMVAIADVKVAYYNSGISYWTEIGGTATGNTSTSGSVISNSVSAFNSNFTMGSISITLPVKLVNFSARRLDGYTRLNWMTANEMNVAGYVVERSDDGINYHSLSTVQAYNRNLSEFYVYDDRTPLHGTAFYRLRIMDNNQIKYSGVVTVSETASQDKNFYVMKNPVSSSIDIYASTIFKGQYSYSLINNAGQVIQSGTIDIRNEGIQSISLQRQVAAGTYILVVRNADHLLQKMIFKE